jgi:uncharacterized protein YhaN
MNATTLNVDINNIIGHMVEAKLNLDGCFGKVEKTMIGHIVYSEYNASLFFKPKGSKNKGYLINDKSDIISAAIVRRNNKQNSYYKEIYANNEYYKMELEKRKEEERKQRKEQNRLNKERFELERQRQKDEEQKEIDEAKKLGGYEELEKEVISYYQSFEEEYFNERFVKTIVVPVLNKLINKGIENVNVYPKHYFDKKRNHKFCTMIEKYLDVKLTNTQKGNVQILNNYLAS